MLQPAQLCFPKDFSSRFSHKKLHLQGGRDTIQKLFQLPKDKLTALWIFVPIFTKHQRSESAGKDSQITGSHFYICNFTLVCTQVLHLIWTKEYVGFTSTAYFVHNPLLLLIALSSLHLSREIWKEKWKEGQSKNSPIKKGHCCCLMARSRRRQVDEEEPEEYSRGVVSKKLRWTSSYIGRRLSARTVIHWHCWYDLSAGGTPTSTGFTWPASRSPRLNSHSSSRMRGPPSSDHQHPAPSRCPVNSYWEPGIWPWAMATSTWDSGMSGLAWRPAWSICIKVWGSPWKGIYLKTVSIKSAWPRTNLRGQ